VHPFHYQTVCTENLSPSWNESHVDVNGGKMDGFMLTTTSVASTIDPTGTRAMGYYDQSDLPYYYELAARFATSDRFFSPLLSNTVPNRLYLFTATSFGNNVASHFRPAEGSRSQPSSIASIRPVSAGAITTRMPLLRHSSSSSPRINETSRRWSPLLTGRPTSRMP